MENRRDSPSEASSRLLRVFFETREGLSPFSQNEIFTSFISHNIQEQIELETDPHSADLLIEIEKESFSIVQDSNLFERVIPSIPLTLPNLSNALKAYTVGPSSRPHTPRHELEKELENNKKKVDSLNKRVLKTLRSQPNIYYQAEKALDHFDQFNEIQNIFYGIDSIYSLPRFLSELKKFRDYETYQMIIHEKGHSSADNISLGIDDELQKSIISVKQFNSLYSLIKKSKSKLFDQTQILKQELGVLGTFLAKEFELKHHSILLIVSRNDFLPPSEEEIDYFNDVFKYLGPVFEYLLKREQLTKKSQMINFALLNFSFPLGLLTEKNHLLFKNKNFTSETYEELQKNPEKFSHEPLINEHQLVTRTSGMEDTASDIFHYHRISLLGELLNTLRHELSNPLFGLKLTADLLLAEDLPKEGREILKEISSNTLRCQTIIRNFSDLYRKESHSSVIEIGTLIQEAVTLTKSESREIKKDIHFEKPLDKRTKLRINPTWITQVLFNLIINSAQAIKSRGGVNPNDFINIAIRHNPTEQMLEIHVTDSGPGIPKELRQSLFRPFFTTKSQGTGLGLSICHNLVQRQGGMLLLNSSENSAITGAWFVLKLPDKNLVDREGLRT